MIAALDGGLGVKDVQPSQPDAPQGDRAAFSRILDQTARDASVARVPGKDGQAGNAGPHAKGGEGSAGPAKASADGLARLKLPPRLVTSGQVHAGEADGDGNPHLQGWAGDGEGVPTGGMPVDILQFVKAQEAVGGSATGGLAAYGLAAYNLMPHSSQEAALAAQAGGASAGAQGLPPGPGQQNPAQTDARGGQAMAGGTTVAGQATAPERGGTVDLQAPGQVQTTTRADLQELTPSAAQARGRLQTGQGGGEPAPGTPGASANGQAAQMLAQGGGGETSGSGTGGSGQHQHPLLQHMARQASLQRETLQRPAANVGGEGSELSGATQGLGQGTGFTAAMERAGAADPTPHQARPDQAQLDRMVQEARFMFANGRNEAHFKLRPESLGEVRLKVVHQDGVLRVDMTVDNHAVRQMVEQNVNDLRQRLLEAHGSEQEMQLNVNVRQDSQSAPQEQAGAQDNSTPVGPQRALQQADTETDAASAPGRPRWGSAGVGVYA